MASGMVILPRVWPEFGTGFSINHADTVRFMQNPPDSSAARLKIGFLLIDRFSNLCLSNALEPLRAANSFADAPVYSWAFYSLDGDAVRSSSGMAVLPNGKIGDLTRVDRLYVIASYGHLANDTPATRRALQQADRRCGAMFGLDAGAWLMASAGLLAGRRATVHWDLLDAFSERFLDVDVEQALWVEDGDVLTCAGASATLGLSRHLIARDVGAAVALDVDALFTPPVRSDALPSIRDPLLTRATRIMRENIEQPIDIHDLSTRLNTSPRTLTRRCQGVLGMTPGRLYRHIRLSVAKALVEGSTASIAEIAVRCGYEDPTALTRAFRKRFGSAPRAFRGETANKST
jgi:transcriptional regulator GlxA family with amidase domain